MFDYIDGGAEDERTLAANQAAFAATGFRPRVLRGIEKVDTVSTILGRPVAYPLVLAPTGFTRIADPDGELAVARAAERAGLPYTLSTLSTRSIEEVRAVSDGRLWFQVYAWRDRGLVGEMIQRAASVPLRGARPHRRHRRASAAASATSAEASPSRRRSDRGPSSTAPSTRAGPCRSSAASRSASPTSSAETSATAPHPSRSPTTSTRQFDPSLSWDDVDWLRSVWDGPIVVKGIQTVDDAVLAAERGVDAIALSNHGGRQLDGAPAAFTLVAPVADAVAGRTEIICDGGIRRGSDIVKAVAAGATAAMAGRAYLYGLGAAGERGVDRVLEWFAADIARTMSLLGTGRVADLERSLLDPPRSRSVAILSVEHGLFRAAARLAPPDRTRTCAHGSGGRHTGVPRAACERRGPDVTRSIVAELLLALELTAEVADLDRGQRQDVHRSP